MSLAVSSEQLQLFVTKLKKKNMRVFEGKSAHILTLVMRTLRLLTLSSGWQVSHGKGAASINLQLNKVD
jgi:hypothetical protein